MMKRLILVLGIAIIGLFSGCSENSTEPETGNGTLKMYLVDAPAGYDAVNIAVDRVEVHVSNGAGKDSGWVVINDQPQTYNLLDLTNGARAVLGEATLAPQHYTQIRLFVGEGSHVIVDGVQETLYIPSSTVKLTHAFWIEANTLYEITLDFDAEKSVFETGSNRYTLQPTIRVIANVVSGTISGTVTPLDASASVWVVTENMDTITTYPDTTGYFKLMAVPEGMYDVYVTPGNEAYQEVLTENVEVTANQNTDLGTIALPVK
jgi:hypothetical protein